MKIQNWTYPDGTAGHTTLPRTWGRTSGICPANAERVGFVLAETEIPDPLAEARIYSKLRLYDALVEAGIWEDVKEVLEASGQWERWLLANELSTNYEPFAATLGQLRRQYGDELTDRILEAAEI